MLHRWFGIGVRREGCRDATGAESLQGMAEFGANRELGEVVVRAAHPSLRVWTLYFYRGSRTSPRRKAVMAAWVRSLAPSLANMVLT